jgi:tRNA(Ile)-lysidine synthase
MTGPAPAVAAARAAVRGVVRELSPDSLVLVACSGGTDSLALAAATAFVAPRESLRAGAVVVDHALLPESADVAERAAEKCRTLGLDPVRVVRVDVGATGGPEAAARTARYAALEGVAAELGAALVLLGHTLDDQAETVLLGLARGSGGRSLAGMPARRGIFVRPFLALRRQDTAATCAALDLNPWLDPSNGPGPAALPRRSRLRHEIMPVLEAVLGPGVAAALARSADQLREDGDLLDSLSVGLLDRARTSTGLDVSVLAAGHVAERRRALRTAALENGVPAGALTRIHLLLLDALVTGYHGQGPVALPGGIQGRRRYGRLTITPLNDEE